MKQPKAPPLAAAVAAGAILAELQTAPTCSLSDHELLALADELQALAARAEAARLVVLRAVDARPEAVPGAMASRAPSALLMSRRVSPRQARLDQVVARHTDPGCGALRRLGEAFADGLVWRAHLDVAVRALERIPRRLLAMVGPDGVTGAERVDACLTEQALTFAPSDVEVLARYLLAVLDPEGTERRDREGYLRRRCHAAFDSTGMFIGSFQLDAEAGAVVSAALAAFSAPRPATTAVTAEGEVVEVRDVRDKGQRQADALAVICGIALGHAQPGPVGRRSGTPEPAAAGPAASGPAASVPAEQGSAEPGSAGSGADPSGPAQSGHAQSFGFPSGTAYVGRIPAHVLVTASVEQLTGTPTAGLATTNLNGPVSSGTLRRLACDAVLQKVLLASSGAVLDLGRSVRLATPHQRRAITARDGSCLVPGCGVPVALCDLHHVVPWADGGLTDLPNLAPLCPRHHTAVHCGEWVLTVQDGLPWVIPPPWVDPLRRPVRNPFTEAVQAVLRVGQVLNGAQNESVCAAAGDAAGHGGDTARDVDLDSATETRTGEGGPGVGGSATSSAPQQAARASADPAPAAPRDPPEHDSFRSAA